MCYKNNEKFFWNAREHFKHISCKTFEKNPDPDPTFEKNPDPNQTLYLKTDSDPTLRKKTRSRVGSDLLPDPT